MDFISKELDAISSDYSACLWTQYTTGFDLGVTKAYQKIIDYKKNPENFRMICDTFEKSLDPIEVRKAQILKNSFKSYHQSEKVTKLIEQIQIKKNELMDFINKYRPTLDGQEITSNQIAQILADSPDRNFRQKAYECRIPLNKILVDRGFIQLIELRKELAQAQGFTNFVACKLENDELTAAIFKSWPQDCKNRRDSYQQKTQSWAQNFLKIENLEPWDWSFLNAKLCSYSQARMDFTHFLKPLKKMFSQFGFDIQNLNLTFDIFPRKNKSEWGYNFPVSIGYDSRVLANVTDRFADYWVLLHETAHGVHYLGLDPEESALNSGVSGIVAEGFANYFGNLAYSKEFISEVFPVAEVEKAFSEFKQTEKIQNLREIATISNTLFDQQLYLNKINSLDDINQLKFSLDQDLLGTKSMREAPWANTIHYTSHPIYMHNYFLGDVMCEKMKTVFSRHNAGRTAEEKPLEFGTFWKEKVLSPSGRYPFLELYEKVCEEKLSIADFLDAKLRDY